MNAILEKLGQFGIVPVVVLEDAKDAAPLAKALCDGGFACAEITFRTEAVELVLVLPGRCNYGKSSYFRRDHASSGTAAAPEEFDFDEIFETADLFHVSGITPVLSETAAALTMEALKSAKKHSVTVSFDLNYRAKLWNDKVSKKQEMLASMMPYVDICFGNARAAAKCLGYQEEGLDFINGDYSVCVDEEHMSNVRKHYGFTHLITTLRKSISASDNGWSGAISDGTGKSIGIWTCRCCHQTYDSRRS